MKTATGFSVHAIFFCAIFLSGMCLTAPAALAQATDMTWLNVTGVARELKGVATLYEEHHVIDPATQQRTVSYQINGGEFARKTVDYRDSAIAPTFEQHDARRGEFAGARYHDGGVELGYREDKTQSIKWKPVASSKRPLVIDAGFDNFIRQQWQQLRAGKKVDFDFAVPSRGMAVHLVLMREDHQQCDEKMPVAGLCLRVYAASYLVRIFFSPLHLLYNDNQQLVRFMGLSNINDAKGDGQLVRIDYRVGASALP